MTVPAAPAEASSSLICEKGPALRKGTTSDLDIMEADTDFKIDALHLFVLTAFAIVQPLLDLLGRNAEFFSTHSAKPIDVVVLTAVLSLGLPVFGTLSEWVIRAVSPKLRRLVHYFAVGVLLALILLPLIKKIAVLPDSLESVVAGGLGLLGSWLLARFPQARTFVTFMSPAVLLFPILFLFQPSLRGVLFPGEVEVAATSQAEVRSETPVVFVIFDELMLTALMNKDREIDALRYPNFAALAETSTWYRDATTVADQTVAAVPAILTGRYPKGRRLPTAAEYPETLLTLLSRSHDLKVIETLTQLCPGSLCRDRVEERFTDRMKLLVLDAAVVYFHIVVPHRWVGRLPGITAKWKHFVETDTAVANGPRHLFERFLASIEPARGRPDFYLLHVLLPHTPWQYLPSRRSYGPTNLSKFPHGLSTESSTYGLWDEEPWHAQQGFQRYLLQLGFVDRLVGDLVARLKEVGIFEESLLVITADHGVSFVPGDKNRALTDRNYRNILPVPLWIKKPGQSQGSLVDGEVSVLDIVPTVADILDVEIPWSVDGVSLLNGTPPRRAEKVVYRANGSVRTTTPNPDEEKYRALDQMLADFGSGDDPGRLFRIGGYKELVGRRALEEDLVEGIEAYTIEIDAPSVFGELDPEAEVLPVHVSGRIEPDPRETPLHLALALDGVIRAVTQTYAAQDGTRFTAMLPEAALRPGRNQVEIYAIRPQPDGSTPKLETLSRRPTPSYALDSPAGGEEFLQASDGRKFPLVEEAVRGYLGRIRTEGGYLEFNGWAADLVHNELPAAVLIFADGEFLFAGKTNLDVDGPPTVSEKIRRRGFKYNLSRELFGDGRPHVRLFAVSGRGVASELEYLAEHPWIKKP